MKQKIKVIFLSGVLGSIVGLVCWLFLTIMGLGIEFLWEWVPSKLSFQYYPVIVCLIGGLLIGICRKKIGNYPESIETIMRKVKEKEKLRYDNIHKVSLCSLLPLLFGGSVGPEAALSGIIASLCAWVGDRFKFIKKEFKEIKEVGIMASLSIIFKSPLYGFMNDVESNDVTKVSIKSKIIIYFTAILSGLGCFVLLQQIYPCLGGVYRFTLGVITNVERLYLLPLSIIGFVFGLFYFICQRFINKLVKPLNNYPVIKGMIGGLLLGLFALLVPYIMFSGEEEIGLLMNEWTQLSFVLLLTIGLVKIIVTNICVATGFKGGHIFPVIFAGVALGLAFATIMPIDPIYVVMIICTSFVATIMQKPLATIMLLMLCFSVNGIILMLASAILVNIFPLPEVLIKEE